MKSIRLDFYSQYKSLVSVAQQNLPIIAFHSKEVVSKLWENFQEKKASFVEKSTELTTRVIEKSTALVANAKDVYTAKRESILNISSQVSTKATSIYNSNLGQFGVGALKENAAEYLGWLAAVSLVEAMRTDLLEPAFSALGGNIGYQVGQVVAIAIPIALAFALKQHQPKEIAAWKQITQIIATSSIAIPIILNLPSTSQALGESIGQYLGPLIVAKIAGTLGGFAAMN